jgi:hypothetical protein
MSAICFKTLFGVAVASLMSGCDKRPIDDPQPPKPRTLAVLSVTPLPHHTPMAAGQRNSDELDAQMRQPSI